MGGRRRMLIFYVVADTPLQNAIGRKSLSETKYMNEK